MSDVFPFDPEPLEPHVGLHCFACGAVITHEEEGSDWEECIECGSNEVTEIDT